MHSDPEELLSQRLRALPAEPAPAPDPRLFAEPQAPVAAARPRRWPALALAATVVGAAVLALWLRTGDAPTAPVAATSPSDVPQAAGLTGGDRSSTTQGTPPPADTSARLQARSAQLEESWRALASQPVRVQRLAHTERASRLKARVGVLDASYGQLEASDYWQRRVALLDALVTAEQAERLARYPGYDVVRSTARERASGRPAPFVFN